MYGLISNDDGYVTLNQYDLFRQNVFENYTRLDGFKQPGLCLAKTHPWLKARPGSDIKVGETDYLSEYLNLKDVKAAMHVGDNLDWHDCTGNITFKMQQEASEWIYTVLKTSGSMRMMHYSGDTDGVLPTYGTKSWIEGLGWDKIGNYTAWVTN